MPTSSNLYPNPRLVVHGLNSLMVYLADDPSPEVLAVQQQLMSALQQTFGDALVELVPSYVSLFIWFDVLQLEHEPIERLVRQQWDAAVRYARQSTMSGKTVVLPCYYSAETGADLVVLARRKGITVSELIRLHSAQSYQVYAIGFAPGFAYLGFVPPLLATPRHAVPRNWVPAGSVALADRQTAVYPVASPGGWQLLGRCPLPLFTSLFTLDTHSFASQDNHSSFSSQDVSSQASSQDTHSLMPLAVGDQVKFVPVQRDEYVRLGGEL